MAPKLVIVGGGFGGLFLAKGAVKAGLDVTLIDRKAFFDVTIASLRQAVQPAAADAYMLEYKKIPNIGTFKQASVKRVLKSSVELDNGEVLNFDYLVIATGSTNRAGAYAHPQGTEVAARKSELQETSERIKKAQSIVIVGAGPVGVELAAEIAEAYAGKKITIINSQARLFEGRPAKVTDACTKWLSGHGVEILHNEKAEQGPQENVVRLKSGKELTADLVIWTVGSKPNTEFLRDSDIASQLNEAGRLRVDSNLRVMGYSNVFAIGDITDVKEDKLAYFTKMHAQMTAKNIAALVKKGEKAKLTAWVPNNGKPALFLSLGKSAGIGALGNCVFPSFMVASMKSKDLMVATHHAELGVK